MDQASMANQLRIGLNDIQGVMSHLNSITKYTNPIKWHEIQHRADLPTWVEIVDMFGSANSAFLISRATPGYTGMSWDSIDLKTYLPQNSSIKYPWNYPGSTPEHVLEGYISNYYNVLDYLARQKYETGKIPTQLTINEIEKLWTPSFIFSWSKETSVPHWSLTLGVAEFKMFQAMMEKMYDGFIEKGGSPNILELLGRRGTNHRSIIGGRLFNLPGTSFSPIPVGKEKKDTSFTIEYRDYYSEEAQRKVQSKKAPSDISQQEIPTRTAPGAPTPGEIEAQRQYEEMINREIARYATKIK